MDCPFSKIPEKSTQNLSKIDSITLINFLFRGGTSSSIMYDLTFQPTNCRLLKDDHPQPINLLMVQYSKPSHPITWLTLTQLNITTTINNTKNQNNTKNTKISTK